MYIWIYLSITFFKLYNIHTYGEIESIERTPLYGLTAENAWLYVSMDSFHIEHGSRTRCDDYHGSCSDISCLFCDCALGTSFVSHTVGCKTVKDSASLLKSSVCFYANGYANDLPTIKSTTDIKASLKLLRSSTQPTEMDTSNVNCFIDSLQSFNSNGYFAEELPMQTAIQYFYIDNKFIGDKVLKWNATKTLLRLYQGKILKLKLRCFGINSNYIESCFLFKVQGTHLVAEDVTTTNAPVTTTLITSTITTTSTTTTSTTTSMSTSSTLKTTSTYETTYRSTTTAMVGRQTDDNGSNTGVIAGLIVAVFIILLIVVAFVIYRIRRRKNLGGSRKAWQNLDEPPRTDSGASRQNNHLYAAAEYIPKKDAEYETLDFRNSGPAYEYLPVKEAPKENAANIYYDGHDNVKIENVRNPLYGQPSHDNDDVGDKTSNNETGVNPIYNAGEIYAECSEG